MDLLLKWMTPLPKAPNHKLLLGFPFYGIKDHVKFNTPPVYQTHPRPRWMGKSTTVSLGWKNGNR